MSNIDRRYSYHDDGVLPSEGEYGVTYLTLYSSGAGNCYDGWIWDPDRVHYSETERTFGYRNPDYPDYCWDDEVVVDLSNPQSREESEFEQGRITSFNTNVSNVPILLQDIDVTGLTEEEREAKATTVLFSTLPLIKDAYIHAEIEVQMKMNLSQDNTDGCIRVEAFYILNDESDRTMRPDPINHYAVMRPNEYNILRLLYWNPALRHEDHNYIGVKLICSGGTAEIGISDDPDYGDAIITTTSAGFEGDVIYSGHPVSLEMYGSQEVTPGDKLHIDDYTVLCTYDTGEIYDVTRLCTFNPPMETKITEPISILTAYYQGLSASLAIHMAEFDELVLTGVSAIHGSYTLDVNDYVVLAYYDNGVSIDVTSECTFSPAMGTTITQTTNLTATWIDILGSSHSDTMQITSQSIRYRSDTGADIVYTLYSDGYLIIDGEVSDSWQLDDDIKDASNGIHTGSYSIGYYTETFGYSAAVYKISGHSIKDSTSYSSVVWTPGAGNINDVPIYYFEVRPPKAWCKYIRTIDYRLKGKPLAVTLFSTNVDPYVSSAYKFNGAVAFKGFENLDASKVISLWGAFYRNLSQGQVNQFDLSFLNELEFPVLDDISNAFCNQDIGRFVLNAPNVRYAYRTFFGSQTINTNPSNKVFGNNKMSKLIVIAEMFRASSLTDVNFASDWELTDAVDARYAFYGCASLSDLNGIKDWLMPRLKSASLMFYQCSALESIFNIFTSWQTHNLISTRCMFRDCTRLANIQSADVLTSNMALDGNISGMFYNCGSIRNLTGAELLITAKVKYPEGAFYRCVSLSDITGAANWDMSNVITVYQMFYDCPITPDGPPAIAGWDVSSVKHFNAFMNKAADTASIADTINPHSPQYLKISPSLCPLEAWNVDYTTTNNQNVFGYEYSNNYGARVLPYVYDQSGSTPRRIPAVSWYKNEGNGGTITGWDVEKEMITDLDIHFDAS